MTYDRDPRFDNGAGVTLGVVLGLCIWAITIIVVLFATGVIK